MRLLPLLLLLAACATRPAEPAYAAHISDGQAAVQAGDADRARLAFAAALGEAERRAGAAHPDTAAAAAMLADVLRAQGRAAEAEPLYRRALAVWERDPRRCGPEIAAAALGLALVIADPREAEALLGRTITLSGDQPALLAAALELRAGLYDGRGDAVHAAADGERALALRPTGGDVRGRSAAMHAQVGRLAALGRLAEAIDLNRDLVALLAHHLGPQDANVGAAMRNGAELLRRAGRGAEAERLERALPP